MCPTIEAHTLIRCRGVAVSSLVVINIGAWLWYGSLGRELSSTQALAFSGGAILIAAVSLLDDFGHVPYAIRLAVHLCAALILVAALGKLG